jgi:hypothetical protein
MRMAEGQEDQIMKSLTVLLGVVARLTYETFVAFT